MKDLQPAVQVACEGEARVKCVGGLIEFSAQNQAKTVKYCSIIIGLQRTQRRITMMHLPRLFNNQWQPLATFWSFGVPGNDILAQDEVQTVLYKPVKRFQMKSNGFRDVQHTGLQSTQKEGTQARCTNKGALGTMIFPSIPTSVLA